MKIPFSRSRSEAGDGPFGRRCEEILQEQLGAQRVLLTPSGTAALELAALTLGVGQGDDVIVPAFTFPTSASAFALRGARIRFCDIRPDTLNLDEELVPSLLGARRSFVVAVHYAGIGCEMDALAGIDGLIEDNAHGLFGRYKGRPLGSFAAISALSFHATKNISCGEGGALVINDGDLIERAEILRDKGTDRRAFERGEVSAYTWQELGSSYVLAEDLARRLLDELSDARRIQAERRSLWATYHLALEEWSIENNIQRPVIPAGCEPAWHIYFLLLPTPDARERFIKHMTSRGIMVVFHYQSLNRSPAGERYEFVKCPNAESAASRIVRLPLWPGLPQDEVIESVLDFRC